MNKTSLSIRLPLLFICSTLIIMLLVFQSVHSRFQSRMIEDYSRMAEGVTQLMADAIDGDKIDYYMEENFSSPEYQSIIDYLYRLKANYPDVLYLYVYRCEDDGGHMIFDIDADEVENGEAYDVGYVYELEEPFLSNQERIMAGGEIEGMAVRSEEDGYLFSYCRPVFRSDGSYACSACVDFSLDHLEQENNAFTLRLMLMIIGIGVVILFLEVLIVRRWVTDPINCLSQCADKFAYDTEEDRRRNIELLDGVDIRNQDEIGTVYQMLRSVTIDSFKSSLDIRDKEEKITAISREAYKDNLTKVGNVAAFKRDVQDMDGEYALVMFDLNHLKKVNDNFGHDKGDLYIKGCCRIICDQYRHSPVYRIGGDEFVVLLKGEDYENRNEHLREIREKFEKADGESWERYSAAAGMALRNADEVIDEVLRRADEEMYAEKRRMRAER